MKKTWAVYKKELAEYFFSPVAYAAIIVLLVYMGWKGLNTILEASTPQANLRPFFAFAPWILCFVGPALTMRLLSEEKGRGTLELLLSMPLNDWAIIMGKYLAALTVLVAALVLTLAYPITLSMLGNLDWGVTAGGYLGLLFMGGCTMAVGMMTSSWTRSQFLAFIVAAFICLILWEFGNPETLVWLPDSDFIFPKAFWDHVVDVVRYAALGFHMENISKGVFDTRDFIYYLSIMGACLMLAVQSLESRKWR
jgi:ABC-2 type transport system permease protein